MGDRVIQLDALCFNCSVPRFETVHPQLVYPVVTSTFLLQGNLGYHSLRDGQATSLFPGWNHIRIKLRYGRSCQVLSSPVIVLASF